MLGLWHGDLIPCLSFISWFMLDLCFQVCVCVECHPRVMNTTLWQVISFWSLKLWGLCLAETPIQEQRAHDGKGPHASLAWHDQWTWRHTNPPLPSGPGRHQHAHEPRCHGSDPWHDGRGWKIRRLGLEEVILLSQWLTFKLFGIT